jgi:hypothetical protein
LDDVHWADQASLDVVKALITPSRSIPNLLLVVSIREEHICYNYDSKASDHLVQQCLNEIQSMAEAKTHAGSCAFSSSKFHRIHVSNLALDPVNRLMAQLTNRDPEVKHNCLESFIPRRRETPFLYGKSCKCFGNAGSSRTTATNGAGRRFPNFILFSNLAKVLST